MIAFLLAVALYAANGITVPPVHYQVADCDHHYAYYQHWGDTITRCANSKPAMELHGMTPTEVYVHELAHHLDFTLLNGSHAGLTAEGFAEAVTDHLLGVYSPESEAAWQSIMEGQ